MSNSLWDVDLTRCVKVAFLSTGAMGERSQEVTARAAENVPACLVMKTSTPTMTVFSMAAWLQQSISVPLCIRRTTSRRSTTTPPRAAWTWPAAICLICWALVNPRASVTLTWTWGQRFLTAQEPSTSTPTSAHSRIAIPLWRERPTRFSQETNTVATATWKPTAPRHLLSLPIWTCPRAMEHSAMPSQWGIWTMCIFMRMSLHLAIFLRVVWISRLRAAQQPAAWTDWDSLPAVEGARARTERATRWTLPTGAPQSAWRPQKRPSHRMAWTLETAPWREAMLTHCPRHANLWLTVRDTPAPSPPNSGPIATPCTYGETTSGHTGQRRGWPSGRACLLGPAASSCCLRSCSIARFLGTLEAPPEKKTWAGSVSNPFQSSPPTIGKTSTHLIYSYQMPTPGCVG